MISDPYVGVRGKISNGNGKDVAVTFSLYPNSDVPGLEWVNGLYRTSNESNLLHELFYSGNTLLLSGDKLEALILLTSDYTFLVIGPILKG